MEEHLPLTPLYGHPSEGLGAREKVKLGSAVVQCVSD